MKRHFELLALILIASFFYSAPLHAQRRVGGGGGGERNVRSTANTSVNRGANANASHNINNNANVNRDVNVDVHGGYYGGGGGYYGGGCCYHPVATAAAVTATAVVTAAVIGSIVDRPPANAGCVTTIVNGLAYQQCGNTWYQPQMSGGNTTYIVVNPPR